MPHLLLLQIHRNFSFHVQTHRGLREDHAQQFYHELVDYQSKIDHLSASQWRFGGSIDGDEAREISVFTGS